MSIYGVKTVPCTLCGSTFPLVTGAMNHPADVLCDGCVLSLYDRSGAEALADIRASLVPRLKPRMGMMPDTLSQAIVDRVERLHEVVTSRGELENMLARRGVLGA
ncbi:MAG: hypothetical protein ACK4YP_14930 [Myxococcota bacterium]